MDKDETVRIITAIVLLVVFTSLFLGFGLTEGGGGRLETIII
ncbi:hypothetical protein J27TS7_44890 [Paenibacillus dendritiformis]|nr:hypothetical protein [Paenibacillus dendritiformis]GIO74975.1 hypothetical protein J27TS7_44890 [Paenibacillus dendritiformis]